MLLKDHVHVSYMTCKNEDELDNAPTNAIEVMVDRLLGVKPFLVEMKRKHAALSDDSRCNHCGTEMTQTSIFQPLG